jgi:Uma2 family endonuclease
MPLLQEKDRRFPEPHYTYADVLAWDEDFRAEIVKGEVYAMSPPLTIHQVILRNLMVRIGSYLEGKPCEVFPAPFGVRLFPKADRSDDTVLEPDLVVVCDPSKIDERGCNGAPDLVIEILSPSTSSRDRVLKFNLYLEAGVREYWVVDPEAKAVQVHVLENGRYLTAAYGVYDPNDADKGIDAGRYVSDLAPLTVLPGLSIDLKTIFA